MQKPGCCLAGGEEHIRSVHLLMALVENQTGALRRPVAAADPGQSQLERLRPLLDAQSDERRKCSRKRNWRNSGEVEFVGRPVVRI
jgi:type VI secretion system protein VasG